MSFVIPPKKDMKTVMDYERRTQLRIFRGQCFNNACVLLAPISVQLPRNQSATDSVFDLAQLLYDEGLKRNWLKIKEE